MESERSGRKWYLFWALVAAVLLAVPAISSWAGATSEESVGIEKALKIKKTLPSPDKSSMFVHQMRKLEHSPDEVSEVGETSEVTVQVQAVVPSKYWIGVLARPVESDLVRSQLSISHGLVLEHVVPDSPAARAGLEAQDILFQADDRPLKDLKTLVKSIDAAEDRPMRMTLIRKAQRQTVSLQPAERPKQPPALDGQLAEERDRILKALKPSVTVTRTEKNGGDEPGTGLMVVMPGLLLPDSEREFPENLEIRVTKKGKQAVQVRVKMADQEWDVDESSLDKLPEDVRSYVKQFLGADGNVDHLWSSGALHIDAGKFDLSKLQGIQPEDLKRWFKVSPGTEFDLHKFAPHGEHLTIVKGELHKDSDAHGQKTEEVSLVGQLEQMSKVVQELQEQLNRMREQTGEPASQNRDKATEAEELERTTDPLHQKRGSSEQNGESSVPKPNNTGAVLNEYVLACA